LPIYAAGEWQRQQRVHDGSSSSASTMAAAIARAVVVIKRGRLDWWMARIEVFRLILKKQFVELTGELLKLMRKFSKFRRRVFRTNQNYHPELTN
jgi:hypothetical protein